MDGKLSKCQKKKKGFSLCRNISGTFSDVLVKMSALKVTILFSSFIFPDVYFMKYSSFHLDGKTRHSIAVTNTIFIGSMVFSLATMSTTDSTT